MQSSTSFSSAFTNPLVRFITDRKLRWLRHSLFILVGLALAFKGDIGLPEQIRPAALTRATLWVDAFSYLFIMAMLYVMLLVLIPKLLFRSRLALFLIAVFIIIALIYLVVWLLDQYFLMPLDPEHKMQHMELSFLYFVQVGLVCAVLLGFVTGMMVFKKWIYDLQTLNELQQINLKTELSQLKSQINPHFLFNTLNNLYVLMKTDSEKASQVLLGLSDLLRYQLYDSAREQILLSKEIEFMNNLLALEKIRKDDFTYEIHSEGRVDGITLPPFLFIPFVENAIKHGASTVGHSYLTLSFRLTDKHLYFYSENSKPPVKNPSIGGIGLRNIQRRLQILYPGNHTLEIVDHSSKYLVNLTIPL